MKNKTEMTVTLAAVVTCLGTALGVASTDLHAATVATQHKQIPVVQRKREYPVIQVKYGNAVNQDKKRPEAISMKYTHTSPVEQGKKQPAVNQKQKKGSGGG